VHLLQHFEDVAGEGFNAAAAARLLPGLLGGLATLFAVAEEEGLKGDGYIVERLEVASEIWIGSGA